MDKQINNKIKMIINLILISTFSLITFLLIKYLSVKLKEKKIYEKKISKLKLKLEEYLKYNKDLSYYYILDDKYTKDISGIDKLKLDDQVTKLDILFCDLNIISRTIDTYYLDKEKHKSLIKSYKKDFKESKEIYQLLKNKYGDVIIYENTMNYKETFDSLISDEISLLNKLMSENDKLFSKSSIFLMKKNIEKMNDIKYKISLKINEPKRIRDKFIIAEDNISQLENEIVNKKGSLYQKVFENIKGSNVSKEETSKWNKIKKRINTHKKETLLKKDILYLNKNLNEIVSELSQLNDDIIKIEMYSKQSQKHFI